MLLGTLVLTSPAVWWALLRRQWQPVLRLTAYGWFGFIFASAWRISFEQPLEWQGPIVFASEFIRTSSIDRAVETVTQAGPFVIC